MYPDLVGKLKKLEFIENEVKTCVELLITGDATAREINEFTHVPGLKIYATLDRMSKKKYMEVIEGTPVYFRCIDPEKLTEKLKTNSFSPCRKH
ncbi:helix-turn-helix domain-containing protein [Methanosarcina sp. T3]|uniref:helix-turn-helix domain-containing protein n=1 Tax=Methanosarcina sp. T3 TaxID=3439062 RepID=UPI003F86EF30